MKKTEEKIEKLRKGMYKAVDQTILELERAGKIDYFELTIKNSNGQLQKECITKERISAY